MSTKILDLIIKENDPVCAIARLWLEYDQSWSFKGEYTKICKKAYLNRAKYEECRNKARDLLRAELEYLSGVPMRDELLEQLQGIVKSYPVAYFEAVDDVLADYVSQEQKLFFDDIVISKQKLFVVKRRYKINCKPIAERKISHEKTQVERISVIIRNFRVLPKNMRGVPKLTISVDPHNNYMAIRKKKTIRVFISSIADGHSYFSLHRNTIRDFENNSPEAVEKLPDLLGVEHKRFSTMKDQLDQAIRENADIIVFPECVMTEEIQKKFHEYISTLKSQGKRFLYLLSGSYYALLSDGRVRNRVLLYNQIFENTLKNDKLLSSNEEDVDIDSPDTLNMLMSEIGLISTPICYDFFSNSVPDLKAQRDKIAADWHLVAALQPNENFNAFLKEAKYHAQNNGSVTIVANLGLRGESNKTGFVEYLRSDYTTNMEGCIGCNAILPNLNAKCRKKVHDLELVP